MERGDLEALRVAVEDADTGAVLVELAVAPDDIDPEDDSLDDDVYRVVLLRLLDLLGVAWTGWWDRLLWEGETHVEVPAVQRLPLAR